LHRKVLPLFLVYGLASFILAGCKPGYSPNTYASTAAQEEAAVQRGTIIGVRQVTIASSGAIGAATGGAAGGVAGSQVAGGPVVTALGAIGGTLVGGIGGTAAAQAVATTKGWEYIVEESGEKLVSVTQTSKTPLTVGLHVLVISDAQQARIVPDYTVQVAAAAAPLNAAAGKPATASDEPVEMNIGPVLPEVADPAGNLQVAPAQGATPAIADPAPVAPPAPPPAIAAVNNANAPAAAAPAPVTPAAAAPAAPVPVAPLLTPANSTSAVTQ
jgi:outer membrane lipoprotein SlyB